MAVNLYRSAVRSLRSSIVSRSLSSQPNGSGNDNYQRPKAATVSLENELPELPRAVYVQNPKFESTAKVTKLSNGLRVASEPKFGQFCTVGKVNCRLILN